MSKSLQEFQNQLMSVDWDFKGQRFRFLRDGLLSIVDDHETTPSFGYSISHVGNNFQLELRTYEHTTYQITGISNYMIWVKSSEGPNGVAVFERIED